MRARVFMAGLRGAFLFLAPALLPARAEPPAYWVWQHFPYLSPVQGEALKQAGVTRLYWQVGTLGRRDAGWPWKEEPASGTVNPGSYLSHMTLIPVVRLEPPAGWSFNPGDDDALITRLNAIAKGLGADEMQLDYEAPDRLIPAYTAFLKQLRPMRTWKLSITALGHWDRFARGFQGVADEITPMFYDLNPAREQLHDGMLAPIGEPGPISAQLERWCRCPLPWRAGLPNFSRVTFVGADGWSRGNLWSWSWNEIWYSPLLAASGSTRAGETVFTVRKEGPICQSLARTGETIVTREPELATLRQLADEARTCGAVSAIYFRLADSTPGSALGPLSLGPGIHEQSGVKWSRSTLSFTLAGDLPPRVFDNGQRGYALAVRCAGGWREAVAGMFDHVTTDPARQHPAHDPLPLGVHELYFWFAQAQDGDELDTGFVRLDGDKSFQWQLLNPDSPDTWHSAD
jgi:hypothetical protein